MSIRSRHIVLLLFCVLRVSLADSLHPEESADSSNGSAAILSDPPSALVQINGETAGRTPLERSLTAGTYIVQLSLNGYFPAADTIVIEEKKQTLRAYHLSKIPLVSVRTIPSRAEVIIDSVYYGTTPLESVLIPVGRHRMNVRLSEHKEKIFEFDLEKNVDRNFAIQLIPEFGFVTTIVSPAGALVSIDGSIPELGPLLHKKIPNGEHTLQISHPSFHHTINGSIVVGPGYLVTTEAELDRFSFTAFEFSMLLPGLGQILDRSYVKGGAEFLLTVGTGLFAYNSHRIVQNDAKHYDGLKEYYELSPTESEAVARKAMMVSAADNLKKSRDVRSIALAVFGLSYLGTLADALLNHSLHKSLFIDSVELVPMVNDVYQFPRTEVRVNIPIP
jgi:hypothetical protein